MGRAMSIASIIPVVRSIAPRVANCEIEMLLWNRSVRLASHGHNGGGGAGILIQGALAYARLH